MPDAMPGAAAVCYHVAMATRMLRLMAALLAVAMPSPRAQVARAAPPAPTADDAQAQASTALAAPYREASLGIGALFRRADRDALLQLWPLLVASSRPERSALMQRAARSAGANPQGHAVLVEMMLGDDLATSVSAASYLAEAVDDREVWRDDELARLASHATNLRASRARATAVAVLARRCDHHAGQALARDMLVRDGHHLVQAAAIPVVECEARRRGTSPLAALLAIAQTRQRATSVRIAAMTRARDVVVRAPAPLADADRRLLLRQFSQWRDAATGNDIAHALALELLRALASDAHPDTERMVITTLSERWASDLVSAAIGIVAQRAPTCPAGARVPLIRLTRLPFAELATPASHALRLCFPPR